MASVVNSSTVQLSWSPPPPSDQNGVITVYTISLVNMNTNQGSEYTTSHTSITISSLNPFTTYHCAIAANTTVGMGPLSNSIPFLTDEDGRCEAHEYITYYNEIFYM